MASRELLNLDDEQIVFLRGLAGKDVVEATIVVKRKIGPLDTGLPQTKCDPRPLAPKPSRGCGPFRKLKREYLRQDGLQLSNRS